MTSFTTTSQLKLDDTAQRMTMMTMTRMLRTAEMTLRTMKTTLIMTSTTTIITTTMTIDTDNDDVLGEANSYTE